MSRYSADSSHRFNVAEDDRHRLAQLNTNFPAAAVPASDFAALLSEPGFEPAASDGQPESDWQGDCVGPNERYRIVRLIGRGGMAKVYLGTDSNRHDAAVAIKVPLDKLVSRQGVRERLGREFRALIELEHPHICRVIDTGLHESVPFMVMPFLSGGNLTERFLKLRVNEHPRSIEQMFSWLRPVATAIDFMHRRNYVHRDIKPQNILFDGDGNPFVCDLGIVRAIGEQSARDSDPGLTTLNAWLGTPGYIAPEVGTQRDVDGRVDLYSLAALTYVFLTDTAPFGGVTPLEIRDAQRSHPLAPACQWNRLLSQSASDVLARGMSVNPDDRQSSCLQLVDELEVACGLAVANANAPAPTRRRRYLWPVLACGGAAVVGLMFVPGALPLPTPASEVGVHQKNAAQYRANGEPEAALEIETAGIKHSPQDSRLYAGRAESLRQLERYEQAIEQYALAIQIEPQAEYFFQRGQVHLAMSDGATKARSDFAAALAKERRADVLGYSGLACFLVEDYAAAINDYSEAIKLAGENARADELGSWHSGRGLSRLRTGDANAALTDFDAAIGQQPTNAKHFTNRAAAQDRLGRQNEAAADRDEARRLTAQSTRP